MNEICMYNDNNKQTFWQKLKKKVSDCVGLTQSSIMRIIRRYVGLKRFLSFTYVCYYH